MTIPRALTVRQPYASRIVHGTKLVENRTQTTHLRGLILIHAASQVHERYRDLPHAHLETSAIIGAVHLVGSHNAETCGDRCIDLGADLDYPNRVRTRTPDGKPVHHWELADPILFSDADIVRDVRGMLGFWSVSTPSTAHLVRLALDGARSNA